MRASFRGAVLITIIVIYAPTASRMDMEKEAFYDESGTIYEKWQSGSYIHHRGLECKITAM
eukprot:117179-Prorocentrum_lima.AAC.1